MLFFNPIKYCMHLQQMHSFQKKKKKKKEEECIECTWVLLQFVGLSISAPRPNAINALGLGAGIGT
jgi:hypothetical protein